MSEIDRPAPRAGRRTCAKCTRDGDLVTPQGLLCTTHAFEAAIENEDWIPLITRKTPSEDQKAPPTRTTEATGSASGCR